MDKRKVFWISAVCLVAVLFIVSEVINGGVLETRRVHGGKVAVMLDDEQNLCLGVKRVLKYVPTQVLLDASEMHTLESGELNIEPAYDAYGRVKKTHYIHDNYDLWGYDCFRITIHFSDNSPDYGHLTCFFSFDADNDLQPLAAFRSQGFGVLDLDGNEVNELVAYQLEDNEVTDLLIFANIDGEVKTASTREYYDNYFDRKDTVEFYPGLKIRDGEATINLSNRYELNAFPFQGTKAKIGLHLSEYEIEDPLNTMEFK